MALETGLFGFLLALVAQVDESYLPPGPRFFSVAQLLQPPQDLWLSLAQSKPVWARDT